VLSNLPAGRDHSGGALTFGPDGNLYASIREGSSRDLSRDPLSLEGSIIRVTANGAVPTDNPFEGSPVSAYGFRNPFGLAFLPGTDVLYATDNGPNCCDRLIRIEPGRFHGWPDYGRVKGDYSQVEQGSSIVRPLVVGGQIFAPTLLVGYNGDIYGEKFKGNLFFGSFTSGNIHRVILSEDGFNVVRHEIILSSDTRQPVIGLTAGDDGHIFFATGPDVYRILSWGSDAGRLFSLD
jgi:glucose/arabinose dehydrogenase